MTFPAIRGEVEGFAGFGSRQLAGRNAAQGVMDSRPVVVIAEVPQLALEFRRVPERDDVE